MLLPQIIAPLNAKMPERLIMLLAGRLNVPADKVAATEHVFLPVLIPLLKLAAILNVKMLVIALA